MDVKEIISKNLKKILLDISDQEINPELTIPSDSRHGDFSTNFAMQALKVMKVRPGVGVRQFPVKVGGINPVAVADHIKQEYEKLNDKNIKDVKVAGPGFINFYLSSDYLQKSLKEIVEKKDKFGKSSKKGRKKILVEFAHPNTHKEFHIGHLRNIITGESVSRLLESQGIEVKRVNYQGDVGMHVAKALFGLLDLKINIEDSEKFSGKEKAEILGKAYAHGSKLYEKSDETKDKIADLNKKIYAKDPEILSLWETTRRWSLEYFDSVYKRVGTKFERLYFESEVFDKGRDIVLSHVKDGIFVKDDGAIIFQGEKHGLHNRVFVTSEGNATYEGKEMGLAPLQYEEFKFDEALHVVGPEQAGYFEVVFKALEILDSVFKDREKHLLYGLVQLKDGKMSSRMGNIIQGEWLLNEAVKKIKETFHDMEEEISEKVGVGAVKYSMLKVGRTSNIIFDFDESISLEGNSGPYLQYTYVRTRSVLGKAQANGKWKMTDGELMKEENELMRFLMFYPYIIEKAADDFAPNILCNYLFELSQKFNLFYQKHKIIGSSQEEFRLSLTDAVSIVLKNGLNILGIETVEKM